MNMVNIKINPETNEEKHDVQRGRNTYIAEKESY
jgi:hypothetical protein